MDGAVGEEEEGIPVWHTWGLKLGVGGSRGKWDRAQILRVLGGVL